MGTNFDSTSQAGISITETLDEANGADTEELLAADSNRRGIFDVAVLNDTALVGFISVAKEEDGTRRWVKLPASGTLDFKGIEIGNDLAIVGQAAAPITVHVYLQKRGDAS